MNECLCSDIHQLIQQSILKQCRLDWSSGMTVDTVEIRLTHRVQCSSLINCQKLHRIPLPTCSIDVVLSPQPLQLPVCRMKPNQTSLHQQLNHKSHLCNYKWIRNQNENWFRETWQLFCLLTNIIAPRN